MPDPLTLIPVASPTGTRPETNRLSDHKSKCGFAFEDALSEQSEQEHDQDSSGVSVAAPHHTVVSEHPDTETEISPPESESATPGETSPAPRQMGRMQPPEASGENNVSRPGNTSEASVHINGPKVKPPSIPEHPMTESIVPPVNVAGGTSVADIAQFAGTTQMSSTRYEPQPEQAAKVPPTNVGAVLGSLSEYRRQTPMSELGFMAPATPSAQAATVPASAQITPLNAKFVDEASTVKPDLESIDLPTLREGLAGQTTREGAPIIPSLPPRAETARTIAGQMAAAISARPGSGGVEIALNPEELGRVSITLNGRDDGVHMVIMAERPETLDLMRRHIAILSAEFEKLGYEGLSLDLGMSNGASSESEHTEPEQAFMADDTGSVAESAAPTMRISPDRGLDMRL